MRRTNEPALLGTEACAVPLFAAAAPAILLSHSFKGGVRDAMETDGG